MQLENRFLVLKWDDIESLLTTFEQADLFRLVRLIREARAKQGKGENRYVVINADEPYFPDVLQLMADHEQEM